jgi:LEA14-like dessication related protein
MKGLRTILILSGAGMIGYALYSFYKNQIKFVKNIDYKINKIKILKLDRQLLSIELTFRLFNYSNIDAEVNEIFLDFFINDNKVGNIQESKNIIIKASGQTDVSFVFNIQPTLVFMNLASILNTTAAIKDAKIKAQGYVRVKSGFLSTTVPYEYNVTMREYLKS